MIIGFSKCYVDQRGDPCDQESQWVANCFVLFGFVIYIGKVTHMRDL